MPLVLQVETRMIHKGDVLKVLPGAKVPTDGELLSEGGAFLNESMISGESQAVMKARGEPVTGGTINTGERG